MQRSGYRSGLGYFTFVCQNIALQWSFYGTMLSYFGVLQSDTKRIMLELELRDAEQQLLILEITARHLETWFGQSLS